VARRPCQCEAIVVRSIRYGEADRVLHLYSRELGRIAAIAKGVRRARSRRAGRLELLVRAQLVLRPGNSDLYTLSSVDTVCAHARLREHREALRCALESAEATARLLDAADPNRPAYNLLANALALLDGEPQRASRSFALAFRLKLMLAAGFAPELAHCASCGRALRDGPGTFPLAGFSPGDGGIVCERCARHGLAFGVAEHTFAVQALARPLREAPEAPPEVLARVDRALAAMVEHHAHVQLRRVA
jgi:DNA repair protein RecO (recombination protein O)